MKSKTLAVEETWRLFSSYKTDRSIRLRNQIVQANLGLVREIAHRWTSRCPEPYEDLVNIGAQGLIKAVERYDPTQGSAFSSFAIPWINGEILHWIRANFGSLKIPRRAFEDAGKVKRVQSKMQKAGRVISCDEAAEAVGIGKHRWEWINDAVQRKQMASLDEILELADETDESEQRRCLHQRLLSSIATLPNLQRRCLVEKYFQQLSDDVIAKRENLSTVQVEDLLNSAIATLKTDLEDSYAHC